MELSEIDGVGNLLKWCRKDAGLSQPQLGELAHCSQELLSMTESGKKACTEWLVIAYAKATNRAELALLNVGMSWFDVVGIIKAKEVKKRLLEYVEIMGR